MFKAVMMSVCSAMILVGCVGCNAVSIVGESLSLAGMIVSLFG